MTRRSSSVSSTYENNSYSDDSHSFWTYVESLKKSGPLFYNYLYRATNTDNVSLTDFFEGRTTVGGGSVKLQSLIGILSSEIFL